MTCPLCSGAAHFFDRDPCREYLKCSGCGLIFVPRSSLITELEEKKRYDAHENSELDQGYRSYLKKIVDDIRPHIREGQNGLDFGCGKTKLLALLFEGLEVESYDLYFHPRDELLRQRYDFIVLSEVIEHLRDPRATMVSLRRCLNPGGQLFIKTKFSPEERGKFSSWFYKRDRTHIQFFNESSFEELGRQLCLSLPLRIGADLYLFRDGV